MAPITRAKRQKMEEKEDDDEKQNDFFDPKLIHVDVWIPVFEYIGVKDIKNLSMVCKSFYTMIGVLPETMSRLTISLTQGKTDIKSILMSERKYVNINIMLLLNIRPFQRILEKFGPNLRTMSIIFCVLNEKDFVRILELTHKNLRLLHIQMIKVEPLRTRTTFDNFKFDKLETFIFIAGNIPRFENFIPETLRSLIFFCVNDVRSSIDNLLKLLEKQKSLKSLKLGTQNCNNNNHQKLFDLIDDKKIQFQLEDLDVIVLNPQTNENIEKFLISQAPKLKRLSVSLPVQMFNDTLKFMPHLEMLEVNCKTYIQLLNPYSSLCPSLKKLTLTTPVYSTFSNCSNFVKQFSNIQEILVKNNIKSQLLKQIAENCSNLKKLTLSKFSILSFDEVKMNNLRELVIGGTNVKLMEMDHMIGAVENLEVLKIECEIIVKSASFFWLLESLKKLKHLEVENGSQLKSVLFIKMSYLFKNLRILKISNIQEPIDKFKEILMQFPDLRTFLSNKRIVRDDSEENGLIPFDEDSEDDADEDSD